jgi:hypothetical protein
MHVNSLELQMEKITAVISSHLVLLEAAMMLEGQKWLKDNLPYTTVACYISTALT